jgi:hypothetical protein
VEEFDPASTRESTELLLLVIQPRHGPHIIAYSLVVDEITCPESCFLATAVVLSLIYIDVTWQWVYMSKYLVKL